VGYDNRKGKNRLTNNVGVLERRIGRGGGKIGGKTVEKRTLEKSTIHTDREILVSCCEGG